MEIEYNNKDFKKSCPFPESINWQRVNDGTKMQFSEIMSDSLDSIVIPFYSLLHGKHLCDSTEHIFSIEKYFSDIVHAINMADKILPRSKPMTSKDYWNSELTDLKKASFDAFCLWRDGGRPPSGPIHDLKVKSHCHYKVALRKAKRVFDQDHCDKMHNDLIGGNRNRFWKSWQQIHGGQCNNVTRINGKIDNKEIAEDFATNFKKIYDDANSDQARVLSDKFGLLQIIVLYCSYSCIMFSCSCSL